MNGSHFENCVGSRDAVQMAVEVPSQSILKAEGLVAFSHRPYVASGYRHFLSTRFSDSVSRRLRSGRLKNSPTVVNRVEWEDEAVIDIVESLSSPLPAHQLGGPLVERMLRVAKKTALCGPRMTTTKI